MTALERITERVNRLGDPNDPGTPRALLTVAEFFDGNDVAGSIGCNLAEIPDPQAFAELLRAMAARPEVKDIRIQVTAYDDPDWPFTDLVYVMTTAAPDEVRRWFPEALAPDEVTEGFEEESTFEPYTVPPGARVIACWWD